ERREKKREGRTVSRIPLNRVLSIASSALEVETRLAYSAAPPRHSFFDPDHFDRHFYRTLDPLPSSHSSNLRPSRTPTPNDRLSTVPVSCAEMI
ncbi:hypothetical protein N7519_002120, partial [Penicillium mononematosum]|uniref:uncharacterized protein n=1 Tax=Penicillium mononematosum TaxID=268346 RepID=UPI002548E581